MKTGLNIGLKQSQKLIMTHSLRQSIEILQLSNIELAEMISREFLENPVLEEESAVSNENPLEEGVNRTLSGDEDYSHTPGDKHLLHDYDEGVLPGSRDADDKHRHFIENAITVKESLVDHLLWQAKMTASDLMEYAVYEEIITSLSDEGFFNPELIKTINFDAEKVKSILATIQQFDPVGCAASGVRDTLLIQARYFFPEDAILHQMIELYFDDIEKLDYTAISRKMDIPQAQAIEKSRLLQNLNPFPGSGFSTSEVKYIVPDVEVRLFEGEVIVAHNDDWVPGIRISAYYERLLQQKKSDSEQYNYLSEKISTARSLIKNISTRRETIYRVVKSIMLYQKEFLEKGPGNLRYLTHHDIADEVGVHESTVSRVASNKAVQTPWGVFELKYFFVSKLKNQSETEEEDQSSDRVKGMIQLIIGSENPDKPYSDEDIVSHLKKRGVNAARRTVAKYRDLLNIPSSSKRKKINMMNQQESL